MLPRPKPVVAVVVHAAAVVVAVTITAVVTTVAAIAVANAEATPVAPVHAVAGLAVWVAGTKPARMDRATTVVTTLDTKVATARPDTTARMERRRVFKPVLESITMLVSALA